MSPGDCILHDRYCFHRSDYFMDPSKWPMDHVLNRYSIRYMPDDALMYDNGFDEIQKGKDKMMMKEFGQGEFPVV